MEKEYESQERSLYQRKLEKPKWNKLKSQLDFTKDNTA